MMKIKRVMVLVELKELQKRYMVHLARAVKDTQANKKCCYHCRQPRTFHLQLPMCKDFQGNINEGSLDPSDNNQCHEEPQTEALEV